MTPDVLCLRCRAPVSDPFAPCPACLAEGVAVNGSTEYAPDGAAGPRLPVAIERGDPSPLERLTGDLWMKDERRGPTWSYKDRLALVVAEHAWASGAEVVVVSSSGNHGAAVAAACTRRELPCVVLTMTGIAPPMRALVRGVGGRLVALERPELRWSLMREAVRELGWYPASNFNDPPIGSNPFGVDGYKLIAWEILAQLGDVPDWVAVPVGYGDGLWGITKGFLELRELGLAARVPRMLAAETSGSIGAALAASTDSPPIGDIDASDALSIAVPRATFQAVHAVRASGGAAITVDGAAAFAARDALARRHGSFHELSSAVGVAAVRLASEQVIIAPGDVVVTVATAPGLKDPLFREDGAAPEPVEPTLDGLASAVGDLLAMR